MTLISSISGIRGTIGGKPGENLTPKDIMMFTKAFGIYILHQAQQQHPEVIIGRDARVTGPMVEAIVTGTLSAMGIHTKCLGLTTTPTVEMAIPFYNADGGIIITASHNPANWNALKLLNRKGEFLTADEGKKLYEFLNENSAEFAPFSSVGKITHTSDFVSEHIKQIIALPLVYTKAISAANFSVVADVINSAGAVSVEPLLRALGVNKIHILNQEPTGLFAHNPEPLPEHLIELSETVVQKNAHLGISVDPDVDRLALVMENGNMFGEEYTLVAVADYILQHTPGNTVSNLSSTRALKVLTESYGQSYNASAVGEVNVVEMMKKTGAVIGGEGNGGVIYPHLHYGRDALVGIALFLSHLAQSKKSMTELKSTYPEFHIAKHKISTEHIQCNFDEIKRSIKESFSQCQFNETDGLKMIFPDENWVHLRTSNTEPIIRIYAESTDISNADRLAMTVMKAVEDFFNRNKN